MNRSIKQSSLIGVFLTGSLLLCSCGRPEPELRSYREIVISPPPPMAARELPAGHPPLGGASMNSGMAAGMNADALPPELRAGAAVDLDWTTPEGWEVSAGQGMRLATFTVPGSSVDCSIVALGGAAGGLESNLHRWLGQVNLNPDSQTFQTFVSSLPSFSTEQGWPVTWVDFSSLLPAGQVEAKSIVAGIVERDGRSIFVKMMGPASELAEQSESLRSLVESLR